MRDQEPAEIGRRARIIRRRRGLSLDVAAGLAGISKPYLSMLERGERRWERRGLLEDVAGAIGCSVTDLTGQPYLPVDRPTADALATLPGIREAVYEDEPADVPVRPLHELVGWARRANEQRDQNRYALAGLHLGTLLTELYVHAAEGNAEALAALVEALHVAAAIAEALGYQDLALAAAVAEHDVAERLAEPVPLGLARYGLAQTWTRVGARRRAGNVLAGAMSALEPVADPSAADTGPAELLGMNHLFGAMLAAREQRGEDASEHLAHARELAAHTGERNTQLQHFGPTNVALWSLAIGVELHDGAGAYRRAQAAAIDLDIIGSHTRAGNFHPDMARAAAQEGGVLDPEAVRHLDAADRAAPALIRHHPIARELLAALDARARQRM